MNISNFTNKDIEDDIIIQALNSFTISGILFLCLISLLVYTLVRLLYLTNING